MAIDVAGLTARLVLLKKARDTGVLVVQHGDTRSEFRSYKEMEAIIAAIEGELAVAAGGRGRGPKYVRQSDKGL